MKKFLLLAILIVMATCANAQSAFSKFDCDVEIGVGLRGANAPFDSGTFGIQRFGVNTTTPFISFANDKMDFYGTLGLLYAKKDGSLFNDITDMSSDNKLKLNQVEIPIHVGLQYALGKKAKVFFDLGPYVGIGVGGKFGIEESDRENPVKQCVDVGVGGNFGFKFKTFILGLGCEKGLTNAAQFTVPSGADLDGMYTGEVYNIKSMVYYVSLRWTFWRIK